MAAVLWLCKGSVIIVLLIEDLFNEIYGGYLLFKDSLKFKLLVKILTLS